MHSIQVDTFVAWTRSVIAVLRERGERAYFTLIIFFSIPVADDRESEAWKSKLKIVRNEGGCKIQWVFVCFLLIGSVCLFICLQMHTSFDFQNINRTRVSIRLPLRDVMCGCLADIFAFKPMNCFMRLHLCISVISLAYIIQNLLLLHQGCGVFLLAKWNRIIVSNFTMNQSQIDVHNFASHYPKNYIRLRFSFKMCWQLPKAFLSFPH